MIANWHCGDCLRVDKLGVSTDLHCGGIIAMDDPLIILQIDSQKLCHFSYWGFGGKAADFLSECGSSCLGRILGLGWALSIAASLSQVGRVRSQWGQHFPHLVPSKNKGLVASSLG